jgi:hypothetical protein
MTAELKIASVSFSQAPFPGFYLLIGEMERIIFDGIQRTMQDMRTAILLIPERPTATPNLEKTQKRVENNSKHVCTRLIYF